MEKRQLVRTFGSALAAATLSFGLFAAPAIADPSFTASEATVAVVTADGNVTYRAAEPDETVSVSIKIDAKDFDDFTGTVKDNIVLTAKNESAKVEQEIPATLVNFYNKGEAVGNIKKGYIDEVRLTFAVNANMLNGTWEITKLTIGDKDANSYKAEATVSGASFEVEGAKKDIDGFPQLRVDTVFVAPKTVNKKINQRSVLSFDVYASTVGNTTAEAVFVNPAGEEIKVGDFRRTITPAEGTASGGVKFTYITNDLPNNVDGYYELKSIKLTRVDDDSNLTTSKTWSSELWDGDYEVVSSGVATIYRAYNPYDGQHLYTDSDVEYLAAVLAGWKAEGLAWYAPINELSSKTLAPVYRVNNPWSGEHHFTTSKDEAATLVLLGWEDEGIAFYTTQDEGNGNVPVYRLFNQYATVGTHHYTTSKTEYDALVKAGWTGEGIGWYSVNKDWAEA